MGLNGKFEEKDAGLGTPAKNALKKGLKQDPWTGAKRALANAASLNSYDSALPLYAVTDASKEAWGSTSPLAGAPLAWLSKTITTAERLHRSKVLCRCRLPSPVPRDRR